MKKSMRNLVNTWITLLLALTMLCSASAVAMENSMADQPEVQQILPLDGGNGQATFEQASVPNDGHTPDHEGESWNAPPDMPGDWYETPPAYESGNMPDQIQALGSAGNQYSVFSIDMSQFIPNSNYGLFVLDGRNTPQSLHGHSFILGEEYWLSAIFYVDTPVDIHQAYIYCLPSVLAGEPRTYATTYLNNNGQTVAYIEKYYDRLHVVFTEYANELLSAGRPFTLRYDFLDRVNEALVISAGYHITQLPTRYGVETIIINIVCRQSAPNERPSAGGLFPLEWEGVAMGIIEALTGEPNDDAGKGVSEGEPEPGQVETGQPKDAIKPVFNQNVPCYVQIYGTQVFSTVQMIAASSQGRYRGIALATAFHSEDAQIGNPAAYAVLYRTEFGLYAGFVSATEVNPMDYHITHAAILGGVETDEKWPLPALKRMTDGDRQEPASSLTEKPDKAVEEVFRTVSVRSSKDAVTLGNVVTLNGVLTGYDNISVSYQWQCKIDGEWFDIPGANTNTLTLLLDNNNAYYGYRLEITAYE